MRPLVGLSVVLLSMATSQAELIAHYLFTDGELLDNEVATGPALINAGPSAVTLGVGTAVFTAEPQLDTIGDNFLISDNASDLNLGTFTLSFWMKTDTVDQGGPFQGIFSSRASGADVNSWQFFSDGADTTGTTVTNGSTLIRGGSGTQTDSPVNPVHSANTWYHVALTSNDADNRILMTVSSFGGTLGDLANGVIYSRDVQIDDFVFGSNRALNQTYGMELANIRVYDSVEAVEPLWEEGPFQDGSLEGGLISHYIFSDGDLLDNEVTGGPALTNAGPSPVTLGTGSAVFTSEPAANTTGDNHLLSDNVADLDLDSFTVSFWMKTDVVDQGGPYQGIFSSRSGADPGSWQFFSAGVDSGTTTSTGISDGRTLIRGGSNALGQTDSAAFALHSTGTWYHVCLSSNGPDNELITTISSEGGSVGDLVNAVSYVRDVQLDDFLFGSNRALDQTYGMELANVRIYDVPKPAELLWSEGPFPVPPAAPPVIDSFTVNDRYVAPGTTVTLDWATSDATTVTLSSEGAPVAASGSLGKVVNSTTTFTLTASTDTLTVEETIEVFVGPPRPNLVVFLVDDMGPMDTSVPFVFDSAGNPVSHNFNNLYVTPNMESMAANGMRFTNAYAQPTCSPTRVSLMTGLNTTGHAVTSWINTNGTSQGQYAPSNYRSRGMEDPDEETLPKWLSAAGYRSIHVGKGHFTDQHNPSIYEEVEDPRFIGFDVNIGGSWQGQPGSYFGTANYASGARPSWLIPGVEEFHGTSTYLTEALTIKANEAVTESVDRGQPFFLYMSHYAVHAPFQLDPRATGDYSGLSGGDLNFATMLEGMDLSLGEIIAHLDAEGVAEETLMIFLGDNGSDNRFLNDNALPDAPYQDYPLRGMKGNRSEGGSRIPLMFAWAKPDATHPFQQALPIPANSVEHDAVACWDLPVTIMNVVDLEIPGTAHTHGHDLSPYLAGTPGTHREQEILIYFPHGRDDNDHFANYREGDWKLTYLWEEERFLLFDLASDPTENTDLAASQPEKVLEMARGMARQFDEEWGTVFGTVWPSYPTDGQGELSTAAIMGSLDLDADGSPDADEDLNANGLVDAGETDPDDADTDDDGTDDFSEIRLGLDPLDRSRFFRALIGPAPAGGRELRWPSQPGLTFRILHSSDLSAPLASWTELTGIPADAVADETTWTYEGTESRRFFIIELE